MIQCAECSHDNLDGLEYCDACGAKLPAVVVSAPEPATTESVPEASDVASAASDVASAASDIASAPQETPAQEATPTPSEPAPTVAIASGAELKAKLTITRGGTVGKEFPLQTGDNLIGRWDPDSGAFPEVDLETDDPEARISRKHALVRVSDHITIEDIGSLNGTFVNRNPRLEPGAPVELHDGDEVIIGKTFFRLSLS